jgi:hypothetical protein
MSYTEFFTIISIFLWLFAGIVLWLTSPHTHKKRWGAGETPPSLAALQKEAQKSGANTLPPEEMKRR